MNMTFDNTTLRKLTNGITKWLTERKERQAKLAEEKAKAEAELAEARAKVAAANEKRQAELAEKRAKAAAELAEKRAVEAFNKAMTAVVEAMAAEYPGNLLDTVTAKDIFENMTNWFGAPLLKDDWLDWRVDNFKEARATIMLHEGDGYKIPKWVAILLRVDAARKKAIAAAEKQAIAAEKQAIAAEKRAIAAEKKADAERERKWKAFLRGLGRGRKGRSSSGRRRKSSYGGGSDDGGD